MEVLTKCHYCGGHLRAFWQNPRFDKCTECDLVIRNPFPIQEELDSLYEDAWDSPESGSYEMGVMDETLASQYIEQLSNSVGKQSLSGKRVLDFGAGKGALMTALLDHNVDVVGVEPFGHDFLVESGFNVRRKLDDLNSGEKFDGIITMEVFEHLREPWMEIAKFFELLKPGGWLCVSTPNPRSLNARLNGDKWNQALYTGHVVFGGNKSLCRIMSDAGFQDCRPANWRIQYSNSIAKKLVHSSLQIASLEGAARVIGWKK